jgi:predicted nucleotidyltransferase component of viral defense system
MHLLWGLKQQGFDFALKGGTSLSKGFDIIHRFSEDVDIQIEPDPADKVKIGKDHNKPAHIQSRKEFFDKLLKKLSVVGFDFGRDHSFDDSKMRNAGIRANYSSVHKNGPRTKITQKMIAPQ